jgi:hypothetical protein
MRILGFGFAINFRRRQVAIRLRDDVENRLPSARQLAPMFAQAGLKWIRGGHCFSK